MYVRVWVDRDGRPRKAVVVGTTAGIFDQSAVDATMQCKFTPAITNNSPVSVRITIPFVFRLNH